MVRRGAVLAGAAAVIAAVILLLIPLHGNGLSGNALAPSYSEWRLGWYAYAPLAAHATSSDLRAGGVQFPQDVVRERRQLAAAVAAAGALLMLAGWLWGRRFASRQSPDTPMEVGTNH
jgi:hypothetical protein